ncbi:hypothetical protein [Intrasporangium calvum]|uniref:DUF2076 domain-containing protein n=1 Tax=Intrasporangium calvum (strain ATCC 23552 / DSM 43043 / JCM 3097 / NBRC 12989 / NCIMB 10167 / NRRL B-3866 / 7 KIP) TaxID=710696 RepID=E6SEX7_INTC7|nr:hypothetical protein [Intrasporangium calvum]ADU48766.1 hypothetical protein Intca_2257 [Intrasporangium calvum DSM 43043]
MGFLDRLLGREPLQQQHQPAPPTGRPYDVPTPRGGASSEDERAIARYRYLLRTAPPEDIEKVHAEAFGQLSPEQRQMVLQRLTEDLPEAERPRSDQPADLARSATRAEMRQPGYLQGAFGGGRGGMGMGGMFAGSMLGTIAGFVVGSAIADAMLGGYDGSPEATEAGDSGGDLGGDGGDAGGDTGGDAGGGDLGGDAGGDAGGGFGGGDFGGGDFGGGDFGGFGDF